MNREADLAQIQPKLPQLARKFLDNEESNLAFNLQPIAEIHLNNEYTYEPEPNGNAQTIYFLDIISFFILLIAWINYINLSTAYATERAKEVGLRKVVGAKKGQLIGQFFTESFLINLMGALTALFIIQLSLPYFNNLVGKTILIDVWSQPDLFTKLGIFCLIGTFITGVYPAFIMASFKPIGVLKGTFSRSKSGVNLRKGLVIFQFAASLVLIAATMTVYQQIEFLVNKNLGIEVDQVIGLNNNASWEGMRGEAFKSKYNAFYGEISESKSVKKAGTIAYLPGGNNTNMSSTSSGFKVLGLSEYIDAIAYFNQIDDHILEVLGIQLLSGRNFNRDITTDSTAVLINESMLKLIGLSDPNKILNQRLRFGKNETNRQYSIVGVIKDFNHNSLKSAVKPTVYQFRKTGRNTLIKLSSTDFKSQLAELELVWERFFPNAPFEYTFLDKRFEQLYNDDKKFGAIFAVFAILAIFIAILGLFGLASYITIQRTKEVGVRKVLGASTQQIILLIFKDFFWLILVAIFAGIPFIYWSMNGWLEGYAYRIDFPWWLLGVSMLIILILAFCTVSMQTYKIATLNPSKTIRQGG
jgi:putative ABC transport system permease protein